MRAIWDVIHPNSHYHEGFVTMQKLLIIFALLVYDCNNFVVNCHQNEDNYADSTTLTDLPEEESTPESNVNQMPELTVHRNAFFASSSVLLSVKNLSIHQSFD